MEPPYAAPVGVAELSGEGHSLGVGGYWRLPGRRVAGAGPGSLRAPIRTWTDRTRSASLRRPVETVSQGPCPQSRAHCGMETTTYVQGGKDQCFRGEGVSLWVEAWARSGAVASPSSSLRPDAPYHPLPTCSANLPEGCLGREKSPLPTDEGRGRFRAGPGGGGEPRGKEGEEAAEGARAAGGAE